MDPKNLSDDQLLDLYEESQREPGAALLAGCLGMAGGWAGLIVFLGARGLLIAVAGTVAWTWFVNRAEAARRKALLASPLPKALCERGLATYCSLEDLIDRAARGADGASADHPQVVLKSPALSVRAVLDRAAGTGRLEVDRTTRDLTPAETAALLAALDAFVADPRAASPTVTDAPPCSLMAAGAQVHVASCTLADPPEQPVHRLARALAGLAQK